MANPLILASVEQHEKHGCIDLQGQVVIPIAYDDLGVWQEGLLAVNRGAKTKNFLKRGGPWGFCNPQGQEVIPIRYEEVYGFCEGLAAVRIGKKWGFINPQGELIIPAQFRAVGSFHNGLSAAANATGKWGYLTNKGQWHIAPAYDTVLPFEDGLARVYRRLTKRNEYGEEEGLYGLINRQGEPVLEPCYHSIGSFHDGLARVEVAGSESSVYTKYGYINRQGELAIPAIYDRAEDFSSGRAAVGMVDPQAPKPSFGRALHYGYIDETGRQIVPPQYSRVTSFTGAYAVVERGPQVRVYFLETDSTGQIHNADQLPAAALLDRQGNRVLDFDYRHLNLLEGGLLLASRRTLSGMGVITIAGEVVLPFEYVNLKYLGHDLFMDNNGTVDEEVLVVNRHQHLLFHRQDVGMPAGKYEFGVFHVRTEGLRKSGLVDTTGRWVVPPIYDRISSLQEVIN
ncbi:WG repeat-containing protein [Hymenobacter persicinus]|uniref:WG repeat-containing protein n=1 Tax=Hymenobacter persicinus TaxID=2025506 RepID=UPI0013E9DAB2|nr:WG repeat-containing protein [Hymenobacter persicinus]